MVSVPPKKVVFGLWKSRNYKKQLENWQIEGNTSPLWKGYRIILNFAIKDDWKDPLTILSKYLMPLFMDFAVFNFADCLITVGAFVLMIYLVVDIVKEEKQKRLEVDETEFINSETVVENERD